MKKKSRPQPAKKTRTTPKFYPDNDPEWEHLEERYSQIGDDMRKLVGMLSPAEVE